MMLTMVGASFRPSQARAIVTHLDVGETVQLRPDPHNEYDATAVAVYYDDTHIGFLPAKSNEEIFARLMAGEEITAEIVAFETTLKPVLEIE